MPIKLFNRTIETIKIGDKVAKHSRYVIFQMVEGVMSRQIRISATTLDEKSPSRSKKNLNFQDGFDILFEMRNSGVIKHV